MKVKIPNGNFIPVNLLRELETSRSSLATKNIKKKPLLLLCSLKTVMEMLFPCH
jgi:hypothetical protein